MRYSIIPHINLLKILTTDIKTNDIILDSIWAWQDKIISLSNLLTCKVSNQIIYVHTHGVSWKIHELCYSVTFQICRSSSDSWSFRYWKRWHSSRGHMSRTRVLFAALLPFCCLGCYITIMSYEYHGPSHHGPLDCLLSYFTLQAINK